MAVLAMAMALQCASAQETRKKSRPSSADGRANLIRQEDLTYLGAFRVPGGEHGTSKFDFGGTAITYNPAKDSLFVVGHDWDQAIAEIQIPSIQKGGLAELPTATVLQPFVKLASRIPKYTLEGNVKVGGLLVANNHLIGTLYEFYDADANAKESHFTLDSLDLANAKVTGLHIVGPQGGGFVGGYMATVPDKWRKPLGVSYLTGQGALAIISRTSAGPGVFGFDPKTLGDRPAPVLPLLYYPLANPLAKEDTKNPVFNLTTEIRGVAFPANSDSVLFFGSHGIGPYCYGTGEDCKDAVRNPKGPHAPPYVYQVWAYDAKELALVKARKKAPWQVRPYDVWTFDFPYREDAKHIGGIAYDENTGRIFVSQQLVDADKPVIHVFEFK
jgi:hypothetical protein